MKIPQVRGAPGGEPAAVQGRRVLPVAGLVVAGRRLAARVAGRPRLPGRLEHAGTEGRSTLYRVPMTVHRVKITLKCQYIVKICENHPYLTIYRVSAALI